MSTGTLRRGGHARHFGIQSGVRFPVPCSTASKIAAEVPSSNASSHHRNEAVTILLFDG